MPALSDATRRDRRQHVLVSAWKCFSRQGFHATSMDDVISETGMSSSSVYRYFRSKEELIDAAAQESLALAEALLTELISNDRVPSPAETLSALVDGVRSQHRDDYDLSKIAMAAWAEALRSTPLNDFAHHFYDSAHRAFATLGRRWIDTAMLPSDTNPEAIADLFVTLMPGLIVTAHLHRPSDADSLVAGIVAFASTATSR
ncbi:hypothetical protein A5784_18365 [Mycobacterium sp. 852013-50091_SCH5140682]|uniref:TetR/AcrR family transcriptional regulator n=1 Tax=Mycobacterium sp. 852013-50091_SCH5140682 TaxID=1834109 RepID=UPI0007EA911D|nr:TetR/AcrR family transcriptional regulator [Mycobacterium sp. 852013-50091_SCH5140682]OBC01669.1 hypothetical protein A5784_18365 [Mycobacterium sp. 852013-50091_SCH5140682]